ncbi:MAG: hypothetical protein LBO07_02370 [Coriobacteriales bacterium]|nr:hypothetical protein [Coriobacteriales bacterium]
MSEGALDGAEVLDADTLDAEVLDADAAFARLEELLALLPAIQAEDQRLTRARNARCLRQADARARYFEAQITQIETTRDQALLAGKKASDEGNAAEEGRHAGLARMCQELYYTRLHSMQKAQDERRDLLQQSDLTLEDPLDEYALADEEYEALEARIRDFQEEYQQLYALCLRLEGLE